MGIQENVDGVKIAKLGDHKQATFRVVPGYHEISIKCGSLTPTRAFKAEPGKHYFFQMEYEHNKLVMNLNDVSITLTQVDSVLDLTTKEEKLSDSELANILAKANPTGAEPGEGGQQQEVVGTLSDDQVKAAIFSGQHDSSVAGIGFHLADTQAEILSSMVVDGGVSGYGITVFTAQAWIELQAADAHRLMKPYSIGDVTPEMRQDVIRVIATPSTPGKLTAQGMSAASSAEHVVLADVSKKNLIQPLKEEVAGVSVDSALRSAEYGAISATFSTEDVKRVQNHEGEFLIVVNGGYRKFFKVKKDTPIWTMLQHTGV
jgi:hypothetical protein